MKLTQIQKELFVTEDRIAGFVKMLKENPDIEKAELLGNWEVVKLTFRKKSKDLWEVSFYNETHVYRTDLIKLADLSFAEFKFSKKRKLIW